MDISQIASLVGSLGFPIVCCGALFWYNNKLISDFTTKIDNSLSDLSKSITDNTTATTKLVTTVELLTKIGGDQNS